MKKGKWLKKKHYINTTPVVDCSFYDTGAVLHTVVVCDSFSSLKKKKNQKYTASIRCFSQGFFITAATISWTTLSAARVDAPSPLKDPPRSFTTTRAPRAAYRESTTISKPEESKKERTKKKNTKASA
jgi:hypothetical protein